MEKYKKLNIKKLFAFLKINIILFNLINIYFHLLIKAKFIKISPTKVGLCVICKEENLYIKEFIKYYKNLGYNHIFLYDNNEINGEKLEDVIQKEIDEGFISIINYRGDKNKPIFRAYIDCYEKNNKDYNWLSFFDVDEFLEIKPKGIKIQEFLDNRRYKKCQNVKFNWLLYSDDNKLHYEKKTVQERFKTALYRNFLNKHVKSTVRGNLPINYWIGATNPHTGENNYKCCSASGKQISKISPYNIYYDYKYAELKHYRTKTIEEYINKMKKGKPDGELDVRYMIRMFYHTNSKTEEKSKIFKKEFNIY